MAHQLNLRKKSVRSAKRVLFVTPRFPFPVIGGDKLRVYHIARYLSKFYRLGLASLYSTTEEETAAPEDGIFEEVYRVRQPRYLSYWHTAASLVSGRSLQNGYFHNPGLKRLIDEKLDEYDLVLAHLVRASDYVRGKGVPCICELTDAISMNYARAGAGRLSVRRLLYGLERERCLEAEKTCLEEFDGCVVVSKTDRDYLAEQYPQHSDKLSVIPNGVRVEDFSLSRESVISGKIVFIGNMRTLQNADAASYFAREVFPAIRQTRPEAEFWVIGAEPGRSVRSLASIPGVEVTGRVDDVRRYSFDAAVSVCPMRIGAGIQNKVLESMAMGIPVVTTSIGAEGLYAKDREHFLVADTPAEMKTAVLSIMNDRTQAEQLSRKGRALVESGYSWDGMLSAYRELIEGVLDRAGDVRSL